MIKVIDFVHNFNGGMSNDDKGAMHSDRKVVWEGEEE